MNESFTNPPISRRTAMQRGMGCLAAASVPPLVSHLAAAVRPGGLQGNIHHSACRWCYSQISLDDLCAAGRDLGLAGIDLLPPGDFPTLKKYGLVCPMVSHPVINGLGGINRAFNRVEYHDQLVPVYEEQLRQTAGAGFGRLICFSGNRAGLDDEQGLQNCALGLRRLLPLAEKLQVTLCMELLNSKRNHKDYQCDRVAWGVRLVKLLGSERFKLLYDIFHMQIMEGDVCATIRANHAHFAHYHTGGVPGRGEIDGRQELHYPRIMAEILATGYAGFVAQEFVPQDPDALASLRAAVRICDV